MLSFDPLTVTKDPTVASNDTVGAAPTPASPPSEGSSPDVPQDAVRWLVPQRIPLGEVTILDGDPRLGKSCVAVDLAARLTRGRAMPFADPATALPPADVIFLSAEDRREVVLSRIAAAEGDQVRVHVLRRSLADLLGKHQPSSTDDGILLPRDLERLRQLLARTGARLLVIDPLVAFLAEGVNWHMDHSIRRILVALAAIAEELDVAVLIIRHLNKQTDLKALYRGGGSIAIIGNARAGLIVVEDPERPDERLLVSLKSNLGAPPPAARYTLRTHGNSVRVNWLGECPIAAADLHGSAALPEESSAIAEAMAFLQETLAEGHCMAATYLIREARKAGISERTLRRAKHRLGVVSKVWEWGDSPGARWGWQLAKGDEQGERAKL